MVVIIYKPKMATDLMDCMYGLFLQFFIIAFDFLFIHNAIPR